VTTDAGNGETTAGVGRPPAGAQPTFLFAALLDGLGPCHLATAAGDVIYANRALKQLLALHGEDVPVALPKHVAQRAVTRQDGVRSLATLHRNGAERQFNAIHRRFGLDGVAMAQILTTYEETTREVQALAGIRRAKDRSDDLMRVVSDWVWETDRDWRFTFVATRDATLLGHPAASVTGTGLFDLGAFVADAERPAARQPHPRQRAAFYDVLYAANHADGTRRLFRMSAVPIFGEQDGQFEGFRGSASDVTERVAAEADAAAYREQLETTLSELKARNGQLCAALQAANAAAEAKSAFLAMMSHELRTPLNAVIGFSEMMEMEAFGPLGHENYKGYVGDVLQSGRFLLTLINDILDLVKFESGRMELHPEEVDLLAVVAECAGLVREQAHRKSIAIDIAIRPGILIDADARRLRQLLLNLLSNAVKFTPDGGRIDVAAATEVDADGRRIVAFTCRDTGIGISEEHLGIVFEPFRQADSSLARKHEGTGLGLPIARSIAELHGGSLTLASAVGNGTTAMLLLPAEGPRAQDGR